MAAKSNPSEGAGEGKDVLRMGLGEVLRDYRKKLRPGLTQAQLSAQAQLPPTAIGDLERGERTIKGPELKSICRVLGVEVKEFMERVKKAQLRAMGEPEGEEAEEAGSAKAPDLYLTVPVTDGDLDGMIKVLHRMIRARRPASPEDAG